MFPVYSHVDPYPRQSEKVPPAPHYPPNVEAVPPRMMMSPATYEPWHYPGNYGYSVPHNSCCNHHDYSTGYYDSRPPYPHYIPVSPGCSYRSYPMFPGYVPMHYVPPPDYAVGKPGYECGKNAVQDYHCCGCPNHNCNRKEDRSIKIEELEPQGGNKGSTLVPLQLKNSPYPVVWVPPEYLKNDVNRSNIESERIFNEKFPRYVEFPANMKSFEQDTRRPWDTDDPRSLGHLMIGQNEKRSQNEQDANEGRTSIRSRVPNDKETDERNSSEEERINKHIDMNPAIKSAEYALHRNDAHQKKRSDVDDARMKDDATNNDGSQSGSDMLEKTAKQKNIPVMQIEPAKNSEKTMRKVREIPVKHVKEKADKATAETSIKPLKPSKLPPICLRVDPLPRRKTGNGKSRLPSPPATKVDEYSYASPKASDSSQPQESIQQGCQEQGITSPECQEKESCKRGVEPGKVIGLQAAKNGDGNVALLNYGHNRSLECESNEHVEVANLETGKRRDGDPYFHNSAMLNEREQELSKCSAKKYGKDGKKCQNENGGEKPVGNMTPEEAQEEGGDLGGEIKLSELDASLLIQSAYRGFQIRKSEPLKKLKQIAEVRKKVVEIKHQIHVLETSSNFETDDRKKMVIGEMIMNLLLKLDTIQGLHPSLREGRKSLAKELVTLQEKLDSPIPEEPEVVAVEACSSQPVEVGVYDLGDRSKDDQQVPGSGNDSPKCNCTSGLGHLQNSLYPCMMDLGSGSQCIPVNKEFGGSERQSSELSAKDGVSSELVLATKTGPEPGNEELDVGTDDANKIDVGTDDANNIKQPVQLSEERTDAEAKFAGPTFGCSFEVANNETLTDGVDIKASELLQNGEIGCVPVGLGFPLNPVQLSANTEARPDLDVKCTGSTYGCSCEALNDETSTDDMDVDKASKLLGPGDYQNDEQTETDCVVVRDGESGCVPVGLGFSLEPVSVEEHANENIGKTEFMLDGEVAEYDAILDLPLTSTVDEMTHSGDRSSNTFGLMPLQTEGNEGSVEYQKEQELLDGCNEQLFNVESKESPEGNQLLGHASSEAKLEQSVAARESKNEMQEEETHADNEVFQMITGKEVGASDQLRAITETEKEAVEASKVKSEQAESNLNLGNQLLGHASSEAKLEQLVAERETETEKHEEETHADNEVCQMITEKEVGASDQSEQAESKLNQGNQLLGHASSEVKLEQLVVERETETEVHEEETHADEVCQMITEKEVGASDQLRAITETEKEVVEAPKVKSEQAESNHKLVNQSNENARLSSMFNEVDSNKKLMEENMKLREMMEKIIQQGVEQLDVISDLTGRVKDLEKKLSAKNKMRPRRYYKDVTPRSHII